MLNVLLAFSSSNAITLSNYLFRIVGRTATQWESKGVALAGYSVAVVCKFEFQPECFVVLLIDDSLHGFKQILASFHQRGWCRKGHHINLVSIFLLILWLR